MRGLQNYFGIDFGTTSTATVGFSVINGEKDVIHYGDREDRPIPSVVAIDRSTGEVFTGRKAWEKRMELSETCEYISSIKSILDSDWEKEICGKIWKPVDVAAEIFKDLKNIVTERSGSEMKYATVATPVGFNAVKRKKLRQAALMAGIDITNFVSEPTAAFFANRKSLEGASNIIVFDWGGGTLDVSVLKNESGKISELATAGMNIAGDDIDRKLAERIHARIARKKKIEISFEEMPAVFKDTFLVRVERAKRQLTANDTVTFSLNSYGEFGAFRETLDYEWFAEIISPEIEQALKCLKKAIDDSGLGVANIDRLIMVGGSSNLEPLLDRMEKDYGDLIVFPDQTMWNVGDGAAEMAMTPGEYYSNQTIGIKLSDGSLFELMKPGISLKGWKVKHTFGIVDTSQEARFVFGGSKDLDSSSDTYRSLAVPTYRFLQEKINVVAGVDENLIFSVKAGSSMRPQEFERLWEYAQMKCYYFLPESVKKNEQ